MSKKAIIVFVCLLLISNFLSAQKIVLEGIQRTSLRGSGPIIQNDEVSGYYFFYGLKKKKGKRPYILEIYDQDLNKTATKEILGKASLYLEQGTFDGENIMFQFYDRISNEFSYTTYNRQAEQLNTTVRSVYEYGNISNTAVEVSGSPNTLFAVPQGGFLTYTRELGRKPGYKIECFRSDGQENWQSASERKSKFNELAGLLTLNDRIVVNLIGRSPYANGRKMTYSLSGLDIKTGAELFEIEIKNEQYSITLVNGEIDEDKGDILLFGEYYPLNVNQLKVPSLGLFTARINASGEISQEKYISWEEDVSKFLPVNKRGKEAGKGFTWFHKIIKTDDGRIFAIGEQFRQVVDGVAVAGEVIGAVVAGLLGVNYLPSSDLVNMVIDDMVIYEFSPEFELIDVKVVEKDEVSFDLPVEGLSTRIMGRYIEAYGLFDYNFAKIGDDGNSFSVGFLNQAHKASRFGGISFNTLTYQDGEYTKIEVEVPSSSEAMDSKIYPAKDGYIMVAEYFRAEKRIICRLEHINE